VPRVKPEPISGVYAIRNIVNDKRYIGSSCDIKLRWRKHKDDLRRGDHVNIRLRRAYSKYGIENLSFEIIEVVTDPKMVHVREQYWIDYYNSHKPTIGYNMSHSAYGGAGERLSEEHKAKVSASLIGNWCTWGRKLSDIQVVEIMERFVSTMDSKDAIAKDYNVNKESLSDILKRKTYRNVEVPQHILDKLPEALKVSRRLTGSNNKKSKLSDIDCEEIRKLYASGTNTFVGIAKIYNVSKAAIAGVVKNKTYKTSDTDNVAKSLEISSSRKMKTNAALTDDQVIELRNRYANGGVTIRSLAKEYGLILSTANAIIQGYTYKWLPISPDLKSSMRESARNLKVESTKISNSKLTGDQVRDIRNLFNTEKKSLHEIAIQYGVSDGTIAMLLKNKTHKDETYIQSADTRRSQGKSGESNNGAKLTVTEVLAIRSDHASGNFTHKALADKYKMSPNAIGFIIRRKTWANI
jgi:group I intron endonuclease